MLIQFTVRNFKTFKDRSTLSLIASNYDKDREEENVKSVTEFSLRVLKSAVLYGANASGKSKFLDALKFMKRFAISSSKESQKGEAIDVEPFKLQTDSEKDSSEFEIVFTLNREIFRYGFEVDQSKVISEWLYHRPKTKEIELFYREGQKFETHERKFTKGNILVKEKLVRENALMLSVAAQFNDTNASKVLEWFRGLKTISGLNEDGYRGFTISKTEEQDHKNKILELLKAADLGIQDFSIEMLDPSRLPKDMPKDLKDIIEKRSKEENVRFYSDVLTTHRKYDLNNNFIENVSFSMENEESSGTKKFFALTGLILDALDNGFVLTVDELDSKVHPNLICKIVSLFNSNKSNPKNAQLIFNTHDTNLLSSKLFRRDQIWFVEKDRYGAASLYSLADFKVNEVRKSDNFEDNYIRGKYGAIPYLGDFENVVNSNSLIEDEDER